MKTPTVLSFLWSGTYPLVKKSYKLTQAASHNVQSCHTRKKTWSKQISTSLYLPTKTDYYSNLEVTKGIHQIALKHFKLKSKKSSELLSRSQGGKLKRKLTTVMTHHMCQELSKRLSKWLFTVIWQSKKAQSTSKNEFASERRTFGTGVYEGKSI